MLHQSCLEKVVSELPADTARAGLVCPQCQKPVVPSSDELAASPLASSLVSQLRALPWAAPFLASTLPSSVPDAEPSASPASAPAPAAPTTEEGAPEPAATAKPSASALFIQRSPPAHSSSTSSPAGALTAPPAAPQHPHPHAQTQTHARAPVPTGIPGVGLFVPPPPPPSSSSGVQPAETVPITGPVLSNLPLTDMVDAPEEAAGDDGFSIQIPPLGSRLAARKTNVLGADYGAHAAARTAEYDDDDKYQSKTLMFVLSVLGLTKRVRGRVVVDRTKALVAGVVVLVVLVFFARLIALARGRAAQTDDPDTVREPLGAPLEDPDTR